MAILNFLPFTDQQQVALPNPADDPLPLRVLAPLRRHLVRGDHVLCRRPAGREGALRYWDSVVCGVAHDVCGDAGTDFL